MDGISSTSAQPPSPKRQDSVGSEDSGYSDSRSSSPDGSVKSISPDTQIPDTDQPHHDDVISPLDSNISSRDVTNLPQSKHAQKASDIDHIEEMEFEETGDLRVYFDATEMVTADPEPPGEKIKKVTTDRAAMRLETSLSYCEARDDIPESFSNLLRGVFQKEEYQETLASLLERDKNAVESLIQWLHAEWDFYQDKFAEAKDRLENHIQDMSPNEAQHLDMFMRNMTDNIGDIIETELVNNLQIYIASSRDVSVDMRAVTADQILGEVPWITVKTYQNEFTDTYLKSLSTFQKDESQPLGMKVVTGIDATMLQKKANPYIRAIMSQFSG